MTTEMISSVQLACSPVADEVDAGINAASGFVEGREGGPTTSPANLAAIRCCAHGRRLVLLLLGP